MKMPKHLNKFMPQGGMPGMMQQLEQSMQKMQEEENKLLDERVVIEKQFLKITLDGQSNVKEVKILEEDLANIDVEILEDIIKSAFQNGIEKTKELKESKMKGIMPNVPGL